MREALKAFLAVLAGYSLADLVRPRRHIAGLLGLDATTQPALASTAARGDTPLDGTYQASVR